MQLKCEEHLFVHPPKNEGSTWRANLNHQTCSNKGMYQPSIIGTSIEHIQHAFHSERKQRNQQTYQDIKPGYLG